MTPTRTCRNGHPREGNTRPGRRDCAICHRERERARARRKGVPPARRRGPYCRYGHAQTPDNLHKGCECKLCHRLDRNRISDPDARRYAGVLIADPCVYCGRPGGDIDHIYPRSRGGSDLWDNLAGICHSCNSRKRTRTPLEFLMANGLHPADLRKEH